MNEKAKQEIKNLMPQGWWLGFGEKLIKELDEAIKKDNIDGEKFEIGDVKEKWGFLNVYCYPRDNHIDKVLEKFEEISANVCIICGKKATKQTLDYIAPYCDICYEKTNKKETYRNMEKIENVDWDIDDYVVK